jgi:hypothetical protein
MVINQHLATQKVRKIHTTEFQPKIPIAQKKQERAILQVEQFQ